MSRQPEQGARVAAIVVAYNGGDDLRACVDSLLAQTLTDLEIIVVDNASSDGSVESLESDLGDRLSVVRRTVNGGYAAGANTGWRSTDAPVVAVLNQDLTLAPDCLEIMASALLASPTEALVTPKLVLRGAPQTVNAIGNDVHLSGVAWCRGAGTPAREWTGVIEVTAISGAAFMARRAFLEHLDGLEESFFMYEEDVDLSLRARLGGAVCLAACDAVATHEWTIRLTAEKFGLLERNRRIMWRRLLGTVGGRTWLVLAQAELLGWVYAAGRGPGHLAAKARGVRAPRPSVRVRTDRAAAACLATHLAEGLPYETVVPGLPGVPTIGAALDRVVAGLSGLRRPMSTGPSPSRPKDAP